MDWLERPAMLIALPADFFVLAILKERSTESVT
jgi:hypothetical protein